MPKIEIFKAGTHTAMQGVTLDFSEALLAAACAAYDPAVHEAPLVIGHPRAWDKAPAYGWVKGMSLDGPIVLADCDQVNADFAEMVRGGVYKKRSASWYTPTNPANPKPGTYYLRHVAFLGAQPPSIKGLRDVDFAEGQDGVVTVEFTEVSQWQRASGLRAIVEMFRKLRDHLVEQEGAEKADRILPAWNIDNVASLAEAEANADTPDFSEPTPEKEPPVATEPTPAELKAQADKLAKDQADFAERQAVFRRDQNAAYLDTLVAEGRPLPVPKDDLLNFMEAIAANNLVVDFAEGAKPAADVFRAVLKAIPASVDFSERAPGRPGNDDITADPTDLARRALDFQEGQAAKGIIISTTDAVAHVQKEPKA